MKPCRNLFVVFLVGGIIAAVAPVSAQGALDLIIKIRKEQMSEQVFQSVLPELQKLAPGDDLSSVKKMLQSGWITSKNGKRSLLVYMPGWINSMSGDAFGGLCVWWDVRKIGPTD